MPRSEYVERMLEESEREAAALDHRYKVALLLVGLGTIACLSLAALRENVLAEWRRHQIEFGRILREKATDEWGRDVADDYTIEMKQIVVPSLGVVDRCVTCHRGISDPRMTDVPQPHRVHPGGYLDWHDPEEIGCTICHRGQGRATVLEEAKGVGHHWDYPMLPTEYAQAACGLCHSAEEVAERGGETYALGQRLFEERGCQGCHQLAGRGGSLGLALDREGSKVPAELVMANVKGPHTLPQWLAEHFANPQAIVDGSQMPPPNLTDEDTRALTTYMLSLQDREVPASMRSPEKYRDMYLRAKPEFGSGSEIYARYCVACHDTGTYGRWDGFFGHFVPAVRGPTLQRIASPEYVATQIGRGRPGTIMSAWDEATGGLTPDEIAKLTAYLLEPVAPAVPSGVPDDVAARAHDPSLKIQGDTAVGGAIFSKQCAACHGVTGQGVLAPSLVGEPFQSSVTDGYLYATVAYGRRGTAMPSFLAEEGGAYSEQQVRGLVAFLRKVAPMARAIGKEGP